MEQDFTPTLYHDAEEEIAPFRVRYEDEDGVHQFFQLFASNFDEAVEEARQFGFYVTEAVNV